MALGNPLLDSSAGLVWSTGGEGPGLNPIGDAVSMMQDSPVGTGDLTADHNAPIHVGVLILLGLGITIVLKQLGFRFAVDAGVGR